VAAAFEKAVSPLRGFGKTFKPNDFGPRTQGLRPGLKYATPTGLISECGAILAWSGGSKVGLGFVAEGAGLRRFQCQNKMEA
jgi:hypothetical protein